MLQCRDAAHNLKKLLPFSLKSWVKYNILDNRINREDKLIVSYLKKLRKPVLISGFKKSGNTWTRFVFFNYFNVLVNNAQRTLTYKELEQTQSHMLENSSTAPFQPGFPELYHTHYPFRKIFKYFSKRVYLYRNPLDTLISYYHMLGNREMPFDGHPLREVSRLRNLDYFVLYYLPYWVYHYKSTKDKADVVLCYEQTRENTFGVFKNAFECLGFPMDENALKQSIAFSSFENIRTMGRQAGQEKGCCNPNDFKGEFTRSGKSGQYLQDLQPRTIEKAQQLLTKHSIAIEL